MIPAYGLDIKVNSRFKLVAIHNNVILLNVDMSGQRLVEYDPLSCLYIRLKDALLVWPSYQHHKSRKKMALEKVVCFHSNGQFHS